MIFFSKIFKKNRKKIDATKVTSISFFLKMLAPLKLSNHHICLRNEIEWFVFEKL